MTCQETQQKAVDYVAGTLSSKERRAFARHVKGCRDCQQFIVESQRILAKIQDLPQLRCPDEVLHKVFASLPTPEVQYSFGQRIVPLFSRPGFIRRAGLAVVVAAIVMAIVVFQPFKKMNYENHQIYTAEEIEQAKKDVELALAYFHHYAKRTETIIEQEVLSKPMVKPIKSTMEMAFKPLLNGGKL